MKHKIFISLLLIFVLYASCNDDVLYKTDPNNLSPDSFFKTAAQVEATTTGTYVHLQEQGLYARHMFFMMDNMSQENGRNNDLEPDKVEYVLFSFNPTHGAIGLYWDVCYRGINSCNLVLNNADKINAINETELPSHMKTKFIGEAKFMRALYYFFLVTRFGGVPLMDGSTFENQPRSTSDEIYDFIIQDLKDATTMLRSKDVEDKGRATQEAAIAMLGKVYLFRNEKTLAMTEFLKIYQKFELEDNYFDNFTEEGEFGKESIFEIVFDDEIGGSPWGIPATGIAEATFRGQEYGFLDWNNVHVSDDLLNEYEAGDGRYRDNFYTEGSILETTQVLVKTGPSPAIVPEGEFYIPQERNGAWRKYQNYHIQPNEDFESGINFKYLRYADVLLMMAECVYETDPARAVGYINEVRERPSTNLTPLATTPTLSSSEVFDAIVHERKCELAGEQIRFNDIIRWGNAATELAGSNFQAGKHELLPIPSGEINNNIELTQADQNPGY